MKPLFKVGDKVIVREWGDMEKEFGLNSDGHIKVKFIFRKEMAELCGETAIIMTCDVIGGDVRYRLAFDGQNALYFALSFSDGMLTEAPTELSVAFKKKAERKFDEALI